MSSAPASVETSDKRPRLETPAHGHGKLYRGPVVKIATPGPGRLPQAQIDAREKQKQEFEAQVHAEAAALAKSAIDQFKAGSPQAYNALADRAWGKPDQKHEHVIGNPDNFKLLSNASVAFWAERVPALIPEYLAHMAQVLADSKAIETYLSQDGTYEALGAGSEEAGDCLTSDTREG